MSTTNHPPTETAAADMWDAHKPDDALHFLNIGLPEQEAAHLALRAACDAGRDHERAAVADLTARLDAERFAHANTAAKVKRMEALAEMMERESGILRDRGDYPNESGMMAARIRIALNGGDQ